MLHSNVPGSVAVKLNDGSLLVVVAAGDAVMVVSGAAVSVVASRKLVVLPRRAPLVLYHLQRNPYVPSGTPLRVKVSVCVADPEMRCLAVSTNADPSECSQL